MTHLVSKLFRTLYGKSVFPPAPPKKEGRYDVLFSVWNVFHSREQRLAFTRNGLSVHWVGNHYPPMRNEVTKRSFCWTSFLMLMSAFLLWKRDAGRYASMWVFDRFSGSQRLDAKLVWAYVEFSPRLLRRAKKRGIPIVLDVPIAHMDDYYALKSEYETCGVPWPDRQIRRWVASAREEYALADWFNVGSSFVKESLVSRGVPADRILVIPYGIDASRWTGCHARRAPHPTFTFIFTASVGPRKGIRPLLLAWRQAAIDDAKLLICGGTEGSMDWNRVCGGLPPNVVFHGRVSHETLAELYAQSDVYVLPSLLEGMAPGLPVLVTHETGLGDFVSDGKEGWFVPARDVAALAERLRWCASHPAEVRDAGEAAFRRMQGQDFAAYGDRCAQVVKDILSSKKPSMGLS